MNNAPLSQPQQASSGLAPIRASGQMEGNQPFLLVREGPCICAMPLASVVETMRPLPIQVMRGMPPYVEGVSIIRGQTVPVVRLGSLLYAGELLAPRRFVVLHVVGRHAALAVEAVVGVFLADGSIAQAVPPLLRDVQPELIASVGSLDRELLFVLQSSRIVPADAWAVLEAHQRSL